MHFPLLVQFISALMKHFLIYGWSEYYVTDLMQFPGIVIDSESESESESELLYWSCKWGNICESQQPEDSSL